MSTIVFANLATGTLAGPITNTSLSFSLQAGEGALFPNPGAGQYFVGTLVDAATGLLNEIVWCTARSGDTMTIVRAQEGTTALNWNAGDFFSNLWTAGQAAAMVQQIQFNPTRIIASSGAFVTTSADYAIGLNRTSGLAASSTTLPSNASVNQPFKYSDLVGNLNAYPLTILAPATFSIAGLSEFVMNINRQTVTFTLYSGNVFSVEQA